MIYQLFNNRNNVRSCVNWIKRNRALIAVLAVIVVMLIIAACAQGDHMLAMGLITGVAGGKHVVDGPLTIDRTREGSPELLLNEVDRQIVKIRPMATPIDQLSRYAGSKHAGSMVVDYYNVDTKPTFTKMKTAYDPGTAPALRVRIETQNDEIFDASDTILVQKVEGYKDDGVTPSNELVLYVVSRDDDKGLIVQAVNGMKIGNVDNAVPAIVAGAKLVRMGRAANELDVMSPQFEALPSKAQNFCQIFKMQVEQSSLVRNANKEVQWNMSDQEEAAIYDMRLGMEKSFLFGVKRSLWDNTTKQTLLFTGGIWNQAGKEFTYDKKSLTQNLLIDMMHEAFTGNAGSKRKILIGGSGLMSLINKIDYTKVINSSDTVTRWGIDFSELRSKFGTLYVLLSEVFDDCGMDYNGIIIDPEYLQKYTHVPFSTEQLNLKASGVRNVDALVLTEASCLVLRYPKAHMRIVGN